MKKKSSEPPFSARLEKRLPKKLRNVAKGVDKGVFKCYNYQKK